ncbi:uncharacterized protein PV06_00896 [Exophiala oligosperma]|uniref:Uncharacterized protein n=2 Tax=Chaetothyriales TaxID=34395 RepID=A0A0D2EK62_9EURO|nr:uncharacterized protein PV06_00896 [Exophiala oligosperma]KAJ9618836.1 hypothetical protein H2204_012912 [Knufia peltigerae]KIW48294.1 hypothetical protein PV06_00896 [Exophiala oligosperma]
MSDLRSEAKPYQRDKNHNRKWARGGKGQVTQPCTQHDEPTANCYKCIGRPKGQHLTASEARHKQHHKNRVTSQTATLARKVFRNEVVDALDGPLAHVSDNSEEEDVSDASAAPIPSEADFLYSYDSRTGPRAGSDLLSNAVSQALRRFENNETDKLIKKEYDVVDGKEMAEISTDEDESLDLEFEMIDHTHLN